MISKDELSTNREDVVKYSRAWFKRAKERIISEEKRALQDSSIVTEDEEEANGRYLFMNEFV